MITSIAFVPMSCQRNQILPFVNIQHLSNSEAFGKIKEWVLKCDKVRRLEPSDYLIGNAIERAKTSGIKPLKFEETLRHKCKALYDRLPDNEPLSFTAMSTAKKQTDLCYM
jgi:hypothetical protein